MFCRWGFHKWAWNKQFEWAFRDGQDFGKCVLEVRSCVRCGKLHPDDQAMADYMQPHALGTTRTLVDTPKE